MNDYTSIVPTVDDIALQIITRTVDKGGTVVGTFDSSTSPTDDQALALAAQAAQEVMSQLGIEDVPDALIVDTTSLVCTRTCQLIELSFYGGGQDSAALATLAAVYLSGLATLQTRLHWTPVRL
jgi:cytosine/adenosine deaminase-related metal-dependent hydrolase